MSEQKKFVNPFIEAAKKVAKESTVPFSQTTAIQQEIVKQRTRVARPTRKASGRGR